MKYTRSEPLPDSPENAVKSIFANPLPKEQECMKKYGERVRSQGQ